MSNLFSAFMGETMTVQIENGLTAKAEAYPDDHRGNPWDEEDGHGPVNEAANSNDMGRLAKRAGQRVLWSERGFGLLYDMKAATEQAKREGWGISGDTTGMTRGQIIAKAVESDFQRLRRYMAGEWGWNIVRVSILDSEGEELISETLGGIESDSNSGECAGEVLALAMALLPTAIDNAIASHEKAASRLRAIAGNV